MRDGKDCIAARIDFVYGTKSINPTYDVGDWIVYPSEQINPIMWYVRTHLQLNAIMPWSIKYARSRYRTNRSNRKPKNRSLDRSIRKTKQEADHRQIYLGVSSTWVPSSSSVRDDRSPSWVPSSASVRDDRSPWRLDDFRPWRPPWR